METEKEITVFLLEDDMTVVRSLEKIISRIFPTATIVNIMDGVSAWEAIKGETRPAVILSIINLPVLNGLQLLKKIRSDVATKDSYVILISENADSETNLKALQTGADDFLTKPLSIDRLLSCLRSASRHLRTHGSVKELVGLVEVLNKQLDEDSRAMYDLIVKMVETRMPKEKDKLARIGDAAAWIAGRLCDTEKEINEIRDAAGICTCGRLALPENLLDKPVMVAGMITNAAMEIVPDFALKLTQKIRNYEGMAQILHHVYENFDGTGIPKKVQSWEIPIGSRILRVAMDYEEFFQKNQKESKAMELLYNESKRIYDHRVVAYYDQYLASKSAGQAAIGRPAKERAVALKGLAEGMVLTRSIMTNSGLMLLSAGSSLKPDKIERIIAISKTDPIIGKIYVR